MKQVIILFTVLLMAPLGSANGLPQDADGIIKAKAKELTKEYAAALGLDSGQLADFEHTLTGYMLKRDKVRKMNIPEADKGVMLKQLISQEKEDMAALLHKGQYKKYLKAKMKLQP